MLKNPLVFDSTFLVEKNMKKIISSMLVIASCTMLSACGSADGWTTINPKRAECSFELPGPVTTPERTDRELYEATFDEGKSKIGVAVFGKVGSKNPQNPNATDADILNERSKELIGLFQQNLIMNNKPADLQLDGDLPVEDGLGQQVRIISGDQYAITQAYITPRGFYFVKIDNADQSNPVVARFMKSFKP